MTSALPPSTNYIGLMSGTSFDGVDAALVKFDRNRCNILGTCYLPFADGLRKEILGLNSPGSDEISRSQILGNRLSKVYAQCVQQMLQECECPAATVIAIGCHGQTIRHRPDLGYTVQIGNAAMLAELTGISVITDFRSRDIAAGGQGAPLVPAFHRAVFSSRQCHRVVVNIGGISNLTNLPPNGKTIGFDCGPGNLLMDAWSSIHLHIPYDKDGAWAAAGNCIPQLLEHMLAEPFFSTPPPKSTGRDTFHLDWLKSHLQEDYEPIDIQATLLELTATSIVQAISRHCSGYNEIYLCGGGARNSALVSRLQSLLPGKPVQNTDILGIPADWVEAVAFAWLAKQRMEEQPGNLPEVTGAVGPRILGATYPA